jgi:hypothetical protein
MRKSESGLASVSAEPPNFRIAFIVVYYTITYNTQFLYVAMPVYQYGLGRSLNAQSCQTRRHGTCPSYPTNLTRLEL